MKNPTSTPVLAKRTVARKLVSTGDILADGHQERSTSHDRRAHANKDVVVTGPVGPESSSDHRWIAMRDFAKHHGEKRQQYRGVSPSRLWRQNYYLSALEAAGVPSLGRRVLVWYLDDIARQLGEPRPPHPSTIQRWRRQVVLSRREAFDRQAYFDHLHLRHTSRRHSWEAA